MSLHILLVDDEYLVLKGLEIMLSEQTEVPVQIVTAMDAVDALGKLKSFQPDVIIADINMPEIDGLTMLEQISSSHTCKYIIISGHEDQDYLKRALRLHVTDYLSKPVDKSCLIHDLAEIYKEKNTRGEHTKLKLQMLLFSGKNPGQTFTDTELTVFFPYSHFALLTAALTHRQAESLCQQLNRYFDKIQLFVQGSRAVLLLNYSAQIHPAKLRTTLSQFLADTAFGLSFCTRILPPEQLADQLLLACHSALSDCILSQLPVSESLRHSACCRIKERTLQPAIDVIRFDLPISSYVDSVYDPDLEIPGNYLCIFTEAMAAYFLVADVHLPRETILHLYQTNLPAVPDKRALSAFLEKTLNFWYDSFTPVEQVTYSSKITAARQYIDRNYTQDLALEQVAESVSINPSYLSYIFRKETGSTFLQYLTDVRMQAACQLLLSQPELSLEEIASRIGYHSASYFHKIFRSRFSVSPRQWQQGENNNFIP